MVWGPSFEWGQYVCQETLEREYWNGKAYARFYIVDGLGEYAFDEQKLSVLFPAFCKENKFP